MKIASTLEFLGVLQRMEYAPSVRADRADVNRFLRHLRSYKNRKAAWLEMKNEIRFFGRAKGLAEKQAQLGRYRYLMDIARTRLEASSKNLLGCFPPSLIRHVTKLLSAADESVRRHLYSDAERCLCNGSLFDENGWV